MAQDFDTTIGLSANATSSGQPVDFDGAVVGNLVIGNSSGISIQYTLDGTNWVTVVNGAAPTVPCATASLFRVRKSTADSYPVPVRLSWTALDASGNSLVVTPGRRVVRFGDSWTSQNYSRVTTLWQTLAQGFYTWADAMLGNPFYVVKQAGVSGNTTAMMLARISSDVLAFSPDEVHMMAGVNDVQNGVASATTIANLTSMINLMRGVKVIRLCTIPFFDNADLSSEKQSLMQVNKFILSAPFIWPNVVVHDIARATDNPEQAGSTPFTSQGLSADGLHPNDSGAQLLARAWVADVGAVPPTFPLEGYNDWTWATYNPRGAGNNTSGSNGFSVVAGSGTGPDGWQLARGATGSGVASKVAHSAESFRRGTIPQVVASFAANNDTVTMGPGDFQIDLPWSSGGGVSAFSIYKPTVANGRNYRCITSGSFAVGADPTGTWSTTLGATFTAGTATLQVIEEFTPGTTKIRTVGDILVSSLSGSAAVELTMTCYSAAYGSVLLQCDALAASNPDSNTKFAYLPSRLTIINPDITIPASTSILSIRARVRGSAGGSVTIAIPVLGIQRWGN